MTYVNEHSVLGTGVAFIAIGILSVALRFSVRRWKGQQLGADDWLSAAALVFVVATNITMIVGAAQHTMGGHGHNAKLTAPTLKAVLAIVCLRGDEVYGQA